MSNLRDIKQRIGSIKKTKKITQAMKMVAASKFKRAQKTLSIGLEYGRSLSDIANDLASRLEEDQCPSLMLDNGIKKEAVIIISSNRGLCGGFNSTLLKKANNYLQTKLNSEVDLYLIGNKSIQFFKNKEYTVARKYNDLTGNITESYVKNIMSPIIQDYEKQKYGRVYLFYNHFISAIANTQEKKQILPIKLKNWRPKKTTKSDFIYEPSKKEVLNELISKSITYHLLESLLNSQAAEEGARMVAMDAATDNAGDVILDLTLQFNRSRQAAITTELTEIIAGAASLS